MIACTYSRRGAYLTGRCPELGLETPPMLDRGACEEALVRLVSKRLGRDDDRLFTHGATVEEAPAPSVPVAVALIAGCAAASELNREP